MKNLFVKENNNGLIAAAVIGGLAAVAVAYLFMTESGANTRSNLKKKAKNKAKNYAAGAISKKTGVSKKLVRKAADLVVK